MKKYYDVLPKNAKMIENSLAWCTPEGKIYGQETRKVPNRWNKEQLTPVKNYGKYFEYEQFESQGYLYCTIKIKDVNGLYKKKKFRVHKLIAQTFLSNPNNLPVVGHKNNIKTDNRLDNLYWTTYSENTQKAVNDKLLVNKKGYDDSQSKPVIMYETDTNKELGRYGSICEASKLTGCAKTTISRQCKYKRPTRKPWYFRYDDEYIK